MCLSLCIIIILLIISDRSYDSLIFLLIRHTVVIAQILSIEMGGQRRTGNDGRLLPKAQTIDILLTAARKHFDLPQLRWPCFYTFFTINGPIQEIQLSQRNLIAVNYNLVNGCKTWSSRDCHRESLQKANDLYIGWSDVTESVVTIRSLFCRYNMA